MVSPANNQKPTCYSPDLSPDIDRKPSGFSLISLQNSIYILQHSYYVNYTQNQKDINPFQIIIIYNTIWILNPVVSLYGVNKMKPSHFFKQIILGKANLQTHQLLSYNTVGKKVIRNPMVSLSPGNNQKLRVVSPGNNQKPSGFSGNNQKPTCYSPDLSPDIDRKPSGFSLISLTNSIYILQLSSTYQYIKSRKPNGFL